MATSEDTATNGGKGMPFWVGFGFLAAFAATILTVILTGLYVRAPDAREQGEPPDAVADVAPSSADTAPSPSSPDAVADVAPSSADAAPESGQ